MAHLYRVVLFALLLGTGGLSHAAASWGWAAVADVPSFPGAARNAARTGVYDSAATACAAYGSATGTDLGGVSGNFVYQVTSSGLTSATACVVNYRGWDKTLTNPQIYTWSVSATMVQTATTPADTAKDIAKNLGKDGELCGLGTPTMAMCYQGFVMRGSWSGTASMNGGTNNGFCTFGPFTADGTTCTGTGTGAPSGAPSSCSGGKVPGTVNGVTVCVDPGTVSAPGSSSSGSSSGTDGSGNSTGSGTSNTGSQTSCTGDTCTTTTTTTTTNSSGGTSTGTTSTTQPKTTFCAENPSSPLCTAGSFSGACGAAPACSGDAVQCAQARYVFETSCSLAKPSDTATEFTAFDQALQAGSGDQTKNLEGNSTVNISAASFDQTELLGAGAGLRDMTITVAGQAVELPFSILNDWFVRLGQVLVAVTFLLCIRIVTRG
jgi:hypothetical protein